MLVGFPPGGANDIVARIFAHKLAEELGQPVLVENRPGNAGVIGAEAVAKAAPDGYTLYLGSTGTNSIAPALTAKMPYDPVTGLTPVSLVGSTPSCLVVNASVPAQNVRDFVALAKARPGKLSYASSGNGTDAAPRRRAVQAARGRGPVHSLTDRRSTARAVDMIISALPGAAARHASSASPR